MFKKFAPVFVAVSVLFSGASTQSSSPELEATPRVASSTLTKEDLSVLGTAKDGVKEVEKDGFFAKYMKLATEAEAKVDAIAGKDAPWYKKAWVRISHPIKICYAPVKHVLVDAVVPIIKMVASL